MEGVYVHDVCILSQGKELICKLVTKRFLPLWFGFPHAHRMKDGVASYRLHKKYLVVRRRGPTALHETWKSLEFSLKEDKLHLQLLLNEKWRGLFVWAETAENESCWRNQRVTGNRLCFPFKVMLNAGDKMEQNFHSKELLTHSRADKRWIWQFRKMLFIGVGCLGLKLSVENLTVHCLRVSQLD